MLLDNEEAQTVRMAEVAECIAVTEVGGSHKAFVPLDTYTSELFHTLANSPFHDTGSLLRD